MKDPRTTRRSGDEPKVDAEFDRFARVAVPMPGGGWFDPVHGSPQMPSGTTGEQWDAFAADVGRLGRAVRL